LTNKTHSSSLSLWKGVFIWRTRARDSIFWNGCSHGCRINGSFLYLWTCPNHSVTG